MFVSIAESNLRILRGRVEVDHDRYFAGEYGPR